MSLPTIVLLAAVAAGCVGSSAQRTATTATNGGYGSDPVLPKPKPTLIPTINIAEAKGWAGGATPKAAEGLTVNAFAGGLDHPRWMHLLPNGDVLVAETNAPAKKDSGFSLRKVFMAQAMKRAGAATKSANRVTLLRDTDGDGVADLRTRFIEGLNSPFGMALFHQGSSLRPPYRGGAFVGQHGSWNRSVPSGYKVIFVPFRNGKPVGRPKDILTGFIGAGDKAMGRPVGVTFDKAGALLVADDVGNVIWRVTPARRGK